MKSTIKENRTGSPDFDSQYLQRLQYDPSSFPAILRSYVSNMRIIALVLIFLLFGGVIAFFSVPRTLNPEINLAIIGITTVLPGSTPTDVELLVTAKIEKEIAKVDDVDIITSTSQEGVSRIFVQFTEGIEREVAQSNVQNAVNAIADLPKDATNPQVKAFDFEDIPIVTYAVKANDLDAASMNSFIDSLVADLEDQNLIDRVVVTGNEVQEVQILISQERLRALRVNVQTIAALITGSTASYPSGSIDTTMSTVGLTIDRASMTLEDLRLLPIVINNTSYRLGDIAEIVERTAPGHVPAMITDADGTESVAVTLNIYRIIGAKIADAYQQTTSVIEEYQIRADNDVTFVNIMDIHREIEKSFNDLYRNLFATVLLVFIVLFLFVGVRQAFLAALSVPLVFMMAFIAMMLTGMTLNFLSIFSLLLSLGLLVDVTIVIISAITTYYRSGRFLPAEAALLVWKDFFATLLVTTLTTVWAFLPLLLASGIIGEFLKPLPIVVSSVLIGSVLVGFLIILPLMVWLLDFSAPRRVRIFLSIIALVAFSGIVYTIFSFLNITIIPLLWIAVIPLAMIVVITAVLLMRVVWRAIKDFCARKYCRFHMTMGQCVDQGLVNISRIAGIYKGLLDRSLRQKNVRRRIVGMVVIFFIFAVSLVGFGFVENEFFPSDDADLIYVNIELPLDTNAVVAEEAARLFLSEIIGLEGVNNYQTQIGAKFTGDGDIALGLAPHNVLITINLFDKEERDVTSLEIADVLRTLPVVTHFDKGTIVISQMGSGPPAGADVTVKLIGDELDVLNAYADQISRYLHDVDGVINVQKSIQPGSGKIVFVPHYEQLVQYGLTVQDIGFYLRTFGSGFVVEEGVSFDDLTDDRDIVIRMTEDNQTIDALERAAMITNNGSIIPLTTLGAFEIKENPIMIDREDQKRILSVTASVEEGYNANEINMMVGAHIDDVIVLPQGYTWQTGGANEENQRSVQSILQAMVLAVILIFLTLIVQLNSYRKSFIVLLVIPLAISGVFVLFAIFGIALSFPALIGVLALFGIVINNSIMIIDQINKNHRANIPFHEAVVEGAASRLEPIMLSSLTTIVGLTPITITQPLWQGLGGAIISGLVFSGVIMLFFIPSVYYMMMEGDYVTKK